MKAEEFKSVLNENDYSFFTENEWIVVNHNGYIDLGNITSLPENVKFKNEGYVYLVDLTSLPENTKFHNTGFVSFENLTSLPENMKFENKGGVYISSLTYLPENTKFHNTDSVCLENLTRLPKNVKFENEGGVHLKRLTECKFSIYINKKTISIGCKEKSTKDWELFFKEKKSYETNPNSEEYKEIVSAFAKAKEIQRKHF